MDGKGTGRLILNGVATGNVGIGTAAPSQRLHVAGNARLTGRFYDAINNPGSVGRVLSATASGTDWITLPSGTDSKSLSFSGTTLSLVNGGSVNLASLQDGTGTDNQNIQNLSFNSSSNILTVGIESGASQSVNLSPLAGASSPIKAFGKVNASGTGVGLSGATTQKLSDGHYRITFSSAMSNANYVIQLTQSSFGGAGNDAPSITYTNEGTNSFEVIITDSDNGVSDGRRVDGEFMFTVIAL